MKRGKDTRQKLRLQVLTMKIKESKLRRIIRKTITETFHDSQSMHGTQDVSAQLLDLASRPEGVSLDELMAKLGRAAFDEVDRLSEEGIVFLDDQEGIVYASGSQPSTGLASAVRRYMGEGTLYVTRGPYGMSVSANDPDPYGGDGEPISVGEMVLDLLANGNDDIFQSPQGVDPSALARLQQKHMEGVQGGMQRWDSEVFEQYYDVDNERVLRLYAKLRNHDIRDVPYDDYE